MADEDDVAAEPAMAQRLLVHLGDQRAGGVQIEEVQPPGVRRHRFGDAVGGEDDRLAAVFVRYLVEILDEDRALGLEPLDDIAVVDDLVADIDGGAELLQRQDHDLDGPVDPGAEAARAAEADRQWRFGHGLAFASAGLPAYRQSRPPRCQGRSSDSASPSPLAVHRR